MFVEKVRVVQLGLEVPKDGADIFLTERVAFGAFGGGEAGGFLFPGQLVNAVDFFLFHDAPFFAG